MTGFLAQEISSVVSEAVTIDNSNWTSGYVTISNSTGYSIGSGSTITFTNTPTSSNSWIGSINPVSFQWKTDFDGNWPEWNKVQEMCKEYPGLEIAFEKFKTVYLLIKDEHDAKLKNQIP